MSYERSYADKLKDPRWQKRRLEIFERDGWACIACGCSHKNLQVHHNWYIKNTEPWEYQNGQMCTLCEGCHEKATEIQEKLKDHLSKMHPSQQAALLHRSESYFDKDRDYKGVSISANREDEEPHRLVRLRTFLAKMKEVNPDALSCLLAIHDHKGCLEATWSVMALESGYKSAESVWAGLGEYEVKHFMIDEDSYQSRDCFTGEDPGEVAF